MAGGCIKNKYKLQIVKEVSGGLTPTRSATITSASRRPLALLQNLLRLGRI